MTAPAQLPWDNRPESGGGGESHAACAGLIRDLRDSDLPAIACLVGSLGYPSTPGAIQRRLEAMPDHLYKCFVADNNGELTGFIGLILLPVYTCDEPMGWILALAVAPEHRGKGIGNRLLAHSEEFMAARGARAFQLFSKFANHDAHRFYERRGFRAEALRFLKRPGG